MGEVVSLDEYSPSARLGVAIQSGQKPQVFFSRHELSQILDVYGDKVAKGEWHDYSISHDTESCTFAVFHRAASGAAYRIVKQPRRASRQGAYSVIAGGRVLRRGRELENVLKLFDRGRLRAVE